jgi:hypothetical protein
MFSHWCLLTASAFKTNVTPSNSRRPHFTLYLAVVFHYAQQMDAVNDRGLVEFPGHSQVFLQLFFAEVLQHTGVDHVGSEAFGILRKNNRAQVKYLLFLIQLNRILDLRFKRASSFHQTE